MLKRKGSAKWKGSPKQGEGVMKLGSAGLEGRYSIGSRFEQEKGTNPEELLGAAHAGCFSMALAVDLAKAGYEPREIDTTARVSLEKQEGGYAITNITLHCEADVPEIGAEEFRQKAESAKKNCPVSRALSAVSIDLETKLR